MCSTNTERLPSDMALGGWIIKSNRRFASCPGFRGLTKDPLILANVSEKAGEAAHVTKLLIEKATLEHRVSRKFAELGSRVYEKALRRGETVSLKDAEFSSLIEETRQLDLALAQVEATLAEEQKQRQSVQR